MADCNSLAALVLSRPALPIPMNNHTVFGIKGLRLVGQKLFDLSRIFLAAPFRSEVCAARWRDRLALSICPFLLAGYAWGGVIGCNGPQSLPA
jgi:hypothetical protein